jgi:HEAT repeat protein
MPTDERYHALNALALSAARAADRAVRELIAYHAGRPDPVAAVATHPLVLRMRTDPAAIAAGLDDPDPRVRFAGLQAISGVRQGVADYGAELDHPDPRVRTSALKAISGFDRPPPSGAFAAAVERIALDDPDVENRAVAISLLSIHFPAQARPNICSELATRALRSDDLWLRHNTYLALCRLSKLRDTRHYGLEMITTPTLWDEDFVRSFARGEQPAAAQNPHRQG